MKPSLITILTFLLLAMTTQAQEVNLTQYPSAKISNSQVSMEIFLPDVENGLYRGTRFDWSGMISSVMYKGHEYFGYWKKTHDPLVHEDLTGPVEGYIKPGLGYEQAKPGEGFIRIGVGVLEKEDEEEYQWTKTYNVLDFGDWSIEQGKDWISFSHELNGANGHAYKYLKRIKLSGASFVIEHKLENTGKKPIETDQFNHNFFMIDGEVSGPSFTISYPYKLSTEDELKGMMAIKSDELHFLEEFRNTSLFLNLSGYSDQVNDHQITVTNNRTGAGVTIKVDQPIYRMCFWACETTLCPENFIWISVEPGETMEWESEYQLFVE